MDSATQAGILTASQNLTNVGGALLGGALFLVLGTRLVNTRKTKPHPYEKVLWRFVAVGAMLLIAGFVLNVIAMPQAPRWTDTIARFFRQNAYNLLTCVILTIIAGVFHLRSLFAEQHNAKAEVLGIVLNKTVEPTDEEIAKAINDISERANESKELLRQAMTVGLAQVEAERRKASSANEILDRLLTTLGIKDPNYIEQEVNSIKADRGTLRAVRDAAVAALGNAYLGDVAESIKNLKEDRRNNRARAVELESALDAFNRETAMGTNLAQVAIAIKSEREATQAAARAHNAQIDKAIQDTLDLEKKREPKDIISVRLFVVATDEFGLIHNGLPFPNTKVTVRFGLMATNYGRRDFLPCELHDIEIGVGWSGDIMNSEARAPVGTRIIKDAPHIAPGDCDIRFYVSEPIEIPARFPPPYPWSPNGIVGIKATLVAKIGDADDPNPANCTLDIRGTALATFSLAHESMARAAATKIMMALAGRDVEKGALDAIVETALASIKESK